MEKKQEALEENEQHKNSKMFDLHHSEELRSKLLSEMTVGEFVDMLPLLKRSYRKKYVDGAVTAHKVESFLKNAVRPYSLYGLSKELKLSYDTIRYQVSTFLDENKVEVTEVKNRYNRVEKQVVWIADR